MEEARVVGRGEAPSTVSTDVREGLQRALLSLRQQHGLFGRSAGDLTVLDGKIVLASSSASGGLRIVVVGHVPGLTVNAANQAALGAGAKVVGATAFKLTDTAILEIEKLFPDMILLTGGVDEGDTATILHNAMMLARCHLSVPTVVAGNRAAADEVCSILKAGGKEARRAGNVMPKAGTLAVESAREEIRQLFLQRITYAKGLDKIREIVPVVLPTPMAVLEGARLGAVGTGAQTGWGDLMVVDVGGATTAVHSIGYGLPSGPQLIEQGLPEPYAKRTVEGDLGIRFNAATLLDHVGAEKFEREFRRAFPALKTSWEGLDRYIQEISRDTAVVPSEEWHRAVDALLARSAVDLAVERHVGRKERIVAREGEAWICFGKDMSETRTLIGTGGVFVHNPYASFVLRGSNDGGDRVQILRPKNARLFLDFSYLLYAVGLLAREHSDVALRIFIQHMSLLNDSP